MSDRIEELITLAALGELSETEEAELDSLLVDDAELLDEVDETLETAAMLQAAFPQTPSPELKASVMGAIGSLPQHGITPEAAVDPSWVDRAPVACERVPDAEAGPSADVIDLSSRRRTRIVSALSAAAAVVLLAGVAVFFARDESLSDQEQVAADAEVVVDAPDTVARVLEGELEGSLTVFYSPGEDALVIDGSGLPVLDDDRAFVLWFVDDDGATPVEIFQPDADGAVLVRVDDVDPTDVTLGVTEEDAGGAESPSDPILAIN